MITLQSDRLRVELAAPGTAPADGFRFDHAGMITEVVLDGRTWFCASEPKNLSHPTSGGRGLCNEYRCDLCEGTAVGEYFPKFGVGLLRKEEEGRFVFHRKYRDRVPFPVDVTHDGRQVVYVTQPLECQGYALRTTKTVTVEENTVTMTILAENVGEETISMEEFCHNFISIDGMAIGSDYRLELPQCPDLGRERLNNRSGTRPGSMRGNGRGLTFCEYSAIDTDLAIDPTLIADEVPFHWQLSHLGARASVACREGFRPSMIAIWAVDHMCCPEIIHGFELPPGQTHEWTRQWRFESQ